jgi:cold shock CspA family protein
MSSDDSVTSVVPNKMLTGCVKWFNNNLNYGFITVLTEGEYLNVDVFSHQSNIKTKHNCFRTLYTGECVQFELTKSDNIKHPFHAVNISGFNGGLLHCENSNYRQNNGKTYKNDNGNGNSNDNFVRSSSVRGGSSQDNGSTRGRGSFTRGGGSTRGSRGGGGNRTIATTIDTSQ